MTLTEKRHRHEARYYGRRAGHLMRNAVQAQRERDQWAALAEKAGIPLTDVPPASHFGVTADNLEREAVRCATKAAHEARLSIEAR